MPSDTPTDTPLPTDTPTGTPTPTDTPTGTPTPTDTPLPASSIASARPASLFVVKLANPTAVVVGAPVTFYIGYGNAGSGAATNARLVEVVRGVCLAPAAHASILGALPGGASRSRVSTYVAKNPGTCTNTITITAANAAPVSYSITFFVAP